jgi:hypothetical protein
MDVKLVQARIIAVAGELNLEFQLVLRDRQTTDRALGSDAGTAPRPVGSAAWQVSRLNNSAGFVAEGIFVHGGGLTPSSGGEHCFCAATHGAGAPRRLDAIRLNEAHGFMAHRLPVDSERPREAVTAIQVWTGGAQESEDAMHACRVRSTRELCYWTLDIDAYDFGRSRARRASCRRLSQQARCATLPSTLPVESSGRMLLSQIGQSRSPLASRSCARLVS